MHRTPPVSGRAARGVEADGSPADGARDSSGNPPQIQPPAGALTDRRELSSRPPPDPQADSGSRSDGLPRPAAQRAAAPPEARPEGQKNPPGRADDARRISLDAWRWRPICPQGSMWLLCDGTGQAHGGVLDCGDGEWKAIPPTLLLGPGRHHRIAEIVGAGAELVAVARGQSLLRRSRPSRLVAAWELVGLVTDAWWECRTCECVAAVCALSVAKGKRGCCPDCDHFTPRRV